MKNTTKNTAALHCLAPDGESVREGEFQDVFSAWSRSVDMGSRWYFYPVHVVTGPTRNFNRARILDVPHGMPSEWKGRTLGKLKKVFAANSQHVADYCNGQTPFEIGPDDAEVME